MLHLTARNFETETKQGSLPVVVMFYAVWCGKCAMMKPIIEEIELKYTSQVKFCEVEIDESAALADEYGANTVPTFALFKNGKLVGELGGIMDSSVFEQRINKIFRNC